MKKNMLLLYGILIFAISVYLQIKGQVSGLLNNSFLLTLGIVLFYVYFFKITKLLILCYTFIIIFNLCATFYVRYYFLKINADLKMLDSLNENYDYSLINEIGLMPTISLWPSIFLTVLHVIFIGYCICFISNSWAPLYCRVSKWWRRKG